MVTEINDRFLLLTQLSQIIPLVHSPTNNVNNATLLVYSSTKNLSTQERIF